MAKKKTSKTTPRSNRNASKQTKSGDHLLREHLLYLLKEGGAHIGFDAAMRNWPVQLAGTQVANFPHTAWMLIEHMRIAQLDILEFSRNAKHVSPKWPEGYWPAKKAPTDETSWKASMAAFKRDLQTMQQLVANRKIDLCGRIPWGDGQTILREALLVADHNAYHLGQLVMLRKSMGI
jgi:hypothetical protein